MVDMPAMMTSSNRKFLIFRLQDSLYALDLAQVAEVSDPPQMWPIPLAPLCYAGALNFHGDVIAVMNLATFLGLPGSSKPGKVIVLRQDIASLAFLVDTVVRIISEEEASVSLPPPSCDGFAAATLRLPDGEAIQLDVDSVVREAETCVQRNQ